VRVIKLLSFDLDDTLWPCEPTIIAAEETLYAWIKVNVPVISQQFDINTLREKRQSFLNERPDLAHDLSQLRKASLKALSKEIAINDDWVDEAFSIYYEARQKVTLFDDVAPVLDLLKTNYRLAAVTNGNADIEKTGVNKWFDFSVSAAEVGFQKPHTAFFDRVMQKGRVTSTELLHIGDDQHSDIFGASQAGIRNIWVNRSNQSWQHNECQADSFIRSFEELPRILAELNP